MKVIHKDEGFCVLASLGGHFAGFGEYVRVYLDDQDGYWYLGGDSHQSGVGATAISVRYARPHSAKSSAYKWRRSDGSVQMLRKTEGICFLSGIGGNLGGYGDWVRVSIDKDGYWCLTGSDRQDLQAEAIGLRIE